MLGDVGVGLCPGTTGRRILKWCQVVRENKKSLEVIYYIDGQHYFTLLKPHQYCSVRHQNELITGESDVF